jgi:hypothetical protein
MTDARGNGAAAGRVGGENDMSSHADDHRKRVSQR